MKFYEVQKYMTLTGHAYHTYAAVMNKDAWESLPADLQKVMADAFDVARDYGRELTKQDEGQILEKIKGQIQIVELTDEGRQKFIERSEPIYKQFEANITPELLQRALKAAAVN